MIEGPGAAVDVSLSTYVSVTPPAGTVLKFRQIRYSYTFILMLLKNG